MGTSKNYETTKNRLILLEFLFNAKSEFFCYNVLMVRFFAS